MKSCDGKVALVTGAAGSGLGRSIALTLAREGAHVIVNYRTSIEAAQAVVQHIEAGGGQALAVAADISTQAGCAALVESTLARLEKIDICIIGPGADWHPAPIEQLAPADALHDLHSETAPLMYLVPLIMPGMYERGWGRLIGIGSHPEKRSPAYAYNIAKAARMQALLLAQDQAWVRGVTVNVIAPGPVSGLGDLTAAVEQAAHGPAWQQRTNVTPQDIAEGVAFLCSDAGQYITGCVLPYLFH